MIPQNRIICYHGLSTSQVIRDLRNATQVAWIPIIYSPRCMNIFYRKREGFTTRSSNPGKNYPQPLVSDMTRMEKRWWDWICKTISVDGVREAAGHKSLQHKSFHQTLRKTSVFSAAFWIYQHYLMPWWLAGACSTTVGRTLRMLCHRKLD